jgi:hypothetical protein
MACPVNCALGLTGVTDQSGVEVVRLACRHTGAPAEFDHATVFAALQRTARV